MVTISKLATRSSQLIVVVSTLAIVLCCAGSAGAAIITLCTDCHGMPPMDAVRKANPHFRSQSSAVVGNHQTHLNASAAPAACAVCHVPVSITNLNHQNDRINMANSIKGYSSAALRAKYNKGIFFNQTSVPLTINATCSSVNCHFETLTPLWGATPYSYPANCNSCHGFPPAGTSAAPSGGLAGSHARHDLYFPGTGGCQKCHPGYAGFAHASSAGRPLKVQGFLRDPLNALEATGTYSGSGSNYLPSKSGSQLFGSCSNLYCHSSGQSATGAGAGTTVTTTVWGGSTTCGACHVDMSASAAATGSHAAHAQVSGTVYACDVCHGAGFGAATVNVGTHVNKQINLAFSGNAAGTTYVAKGTVFIPGSAVYSSCTTNKCHGAMNPTWGANTAKARCQKCHGYRSSAWNALNSATVTTDVKAGAHFNHISSTGALKYAKPFSCAECHLASISLSTDNVNATGHFDTAGPAEVSFSTLANTKSSSPIYSAPACAAIYCHGANMASNVSNPPASRIASPTWNAPFLGVASVVGNGSTTPGSGDCSTCHGYPPMTATHSGKIATACAGCHGHVNAAGTGFIDAAKHVNGVVDASGGHIFPYGGSVHKPGGSGNPQANATPPYSNCSGCHDTTANTGTYPVAAGTAPKCTACHNSIGVAASANHFNGTTPAPGCWDCHGNVQAASLTNAATSNSPTNSNRAITNFPNRRGSHSQGEHLGQPCTTCHAWTNSDPRHGWHNRHARYNAYSSVKQKIPGWTGSATGNRSADTGNCSGVNFTGAGVSGCTSNHPGDSWW